MIDRIPRLCHARPPLPRWIGVVWRRMRGCLSPAKPGREVMESSGATRLGAHSQPYGSRAARARACSGLQASEAVVCSAKFIAAIGERPENRSGCAPLAGMSVLGCHGQTRRGLAFTLSARSTVQCEAFLILAAGSIGECWPTIAPVWYTTGRSPRLRMHPISFRLRFNVSIERATGVRPRRRLMGRREFDRTARVCADHGWH